MTSERRTGLWGITQLLALHLSPAQGSLRSTRDEHCKLIQMLKPVFAFPYALRLELYTTLTDILSNSTVVVRMSLRLVYFFFSAESIVGVAS